jgi:hypothetical protein
MAAQKTELQVPPPNLLLGEGFRARLKEVQGARTAYAFAKVCGIPESGMRGYLSGPGLPLLENVVKIADACEVSVSWLATGRGPREATALAKLGQPTLDAGLLKNVLIAVEGHLRDHNLVMKTDKKAALVVLLYEHFSERDGRVDTEAFRRFMDALS